MSARVRAFQVDAFTSQRFCGNPAGVVLDADILSEPDMRALARELGGDTAFLLRPDAPDHDLRVRFFTPRGEAPFIGHATLAAHAVLASLQLEPRPRQRQQSGLVEVEVRAGTPARIAIRQPPPQLARPLEPRELADVLDALGLARTDLDARCPPMIAGRTGTRLLLGVTGAVLARVQADLARLRTLSAQIGAPGYFLFTLQPAVSGVYSEARMFCPALGIDEDPVSGNAHALLGTYLLHHGLIACPAAGNARPERIEFTGGQGQYLGRPGRVTVVLELEQRVLRAVSIIGEAVVVFATTLDF
ncbi:MAG TPA: PhzF family phenazine biosynthesis isomerase [Steroidobacteraceae bacterium]